MKKSNIILAGFLCVLMLVGWIVYGSAQIKEKSAYNAYIAAAEQYEEKGLYQKAVSNWESALAYKADMKTLESWISACEAAYNDGVMTAKDYEKKLLDMCDRTEDPLYWEKLLRHEMNCGSYDKAYDKLIAAQKAGISSDALMNISDSLTYMIKNSAKPYERVRQNAAGYFCVDDGEKWGIISSNGEVYFDCTYEYISPYSVEGYYLLVSEKGQRLMGASGMVEDVIDIDFLESGAYGNGMMPFCVAENQWKYYCFADRKMDSKTYEMASNYQNGVAAVKQNGKWKLIDTKGEQVTNTAFDDIKLHSGGDYQSSGVMVASVGGKYNLYDANGAMIAEISAADMDVARDSYIAFKDKTGKWGYVDRTGNIVIKPKYENAKSFSGGLGAVCVEGLWGFVKDSGKLVIDAKYYDGGYFNAVGVCFASVYSGSYHKLSLRYR